MAKRSARAVDSGDDHTTATSTMACGQPLLRVPVLCPLCLSAPVIDPIVLHTAEPDARSCVACRECVTKWSALFSTPTTAPGSCDEAPVFPCPLCDAAVSTLDNATLLPLSVIDCSSAALHNPFVPAAAPVCCGLPCAQLDLAACVSFWEKAREVEARVACKDGEGVTARASNGPCADSSLCGVCEENTATLMCVQCDFALCVGCQDTTHSKGRFKQHEVRSLTQETDAQRFTGGLGVARRSSPSDLTHSLPPSQCGTHTQQPLALYCRTCTMCICVTCYFAGTHRGHDVAPLVDTAVEARKDLQARAAAMAQTASDASEARQRLIELAPLYTRLAADAEAQIHSTFETLRDTLSQRERDLVTEVRAAAADMEAAITVTARRSGEAAAAAAGTADKSHAFSSAADDVTVMNALPLLERAQTALHALATRQSSSTACAGARLADRLSPSSDEHALISFELFPSDADGSAVAPCGEDRQRAAVKEYASLLSSLGQLTCERRFPLTDRAVDVPAAEEAEDVSPSQMTTSNRSTKGQKALQDTDSGSDDAQVPEDDQQDAVHAAAREASAGVRAADQQTVVEEEEKEKKESVELSNEIATTAPAVTVCSNAAASTETTCPLPVVRPVDGSFRRTEVHLLAERQSVLAPAIVSRARPTELLRFAAPGVSCSDIDPTAKNVLGASSSGCALSHTRFLDIRFDRGAGERPWDGSATGGPSNARALPGLLPAHTSARFGKESAPEREERSAKAARLELRDDSPSQDPLAAPSSSRVVPAALTTDKPLAFTSHTSSALLTSSRLHSATVSLDRDVATRKDVKATADAAKSSFSLQLRL